MNSLSKYFDLIKEYPSLFCNSGEFGEIRIIQDPQKIKVEQDKIRKELLDQGNPESWIDIGVLSEDQWFWVVRDMVEFPDGKIGGYIRFINRKSKEAGGFNVILLCVQNDQVLMIRKYRHEERGWSWEFPRGFGEPGLTSEENAQKELEEEIGVKTSRLTLLTKITEEKGGTAVFYVEIPINQKITLEIGDGIASHCWVSLPDLEKLVAQGKLSDWFSLWAYALMKSKNFV